jgi:hypothetical protein
MKIMLVLRTETERYKFKTIVIVQAGNIPLLQFSALLSLCILKYQEFTSTSYVIKLLG